MRIPLTMARFPDSANPQDEADLWDRYQEHLSDLTGQMQLGVCSGCDQCGIRCISGIRVSRAEWERIKESLAVQPSWEVNRVAGQEKTVPWPGAEDMDLTVTCCEFRDMERNCCSLYSARPTVCRLLGHTYWMPCPIGAITEIPEGADKLWEEYRTFERLTFDEWRQRDSEEAGEHPFEKEISENIGEQRKSGRK